jgi:hypothetical protein
MQFTRQKDLLCPALLSRSYTMRKRTERNLSGWVTLLPRRIKVGLDSDSEKAKNGGKVNLTAYLFVSRALKARPSYNQPH